MICMLCAGTRCCCAKLLMHLLEDAQDVSFVRAELCYSPAL